MKELAFFSATPVPLRYEIIYAPVVKSHVKALGRQYYSLIRRTIEEQLSFEPLRETRNRRPLKRLAWFGATWELRFGPDNRFRVFYRVNTDKTFDNFMQLAFLLEELFGRRVELITPEALSPYIGPHIMREVEYVPLGA